MIYAQQGQIRRRGPLCRESKNYIYEKTLRSSWILESNGKAILKGINLLNVAESSKKIRPPKTSTRFDPSRWLEHLRLTLFIDEWKHKINFSDLGSKSLNRGENKMFFWYIWMRRTWIILKKVKQKERSQ